MMERIAIIGCGGHARSVADILMDNQDGIQIKLYDSNAGKGEVLLSGTCPVYLLPAHSAFDAEYVFIAIGDNQQRKEMAGRYADDERIHFVSVISRRAYVSKFALVDTGTFVAAGAHIGPEAQIGAFSIINTNAVVEHEAVIGCFSHISVNAAVCGRCTIGDNVFLGAGATVRDGVTICPDVVVGAGSVVVHDITKPGTYVGCPARKID